MYNKSKMKGKRFEEKISNIIRNKWSLNKHECHRALSSGTYNTDYSDIIFVPESIKRPHIVIECKIRKNIAINSLLYFSFNNELSSWVEQIQDASKKYIKEFDIPPLKLIVFGLDRVDPLVIINMEEYNKLLKEYKKLNLTIVEKDFLKWNNVYIFKYDNEQYISTHFEYFISNVINPIRRNN